MKIYVAGPYSADTWAKKQSNTDRAVWAGLEILMKGHNPYVPHLSHYIDEKAIDAQITIDWQTWMDIDFQWLDACDAILYLDPSKGADMELTKAKADGKIIYYSVNEIPEVNIKQLMK